MGARSKIISKLPQFRVLKDEEYTENVLKLYKAIKGNTSKIGTPIIEIHYGLTTKDEEAKNSSERDLTFPRDKNLWNLYELANSPIEEVSYLLGNYFEEEAINLLTGSSDVGKTNLYQDIGLAIVEGGSRVFGEVLRTKHNRVLFVSTENSLRSIKTRLIKKIHGKNLSRETMENLMIYTSKDNILENIRTILSDKLCDLIVIDPFGDSFRGNLNSAIDVRNFFDGYEDLINDFGCTIIFVHHNTKYSAQKGPNKDKTLGSEAIVSRSRQVVEMTRVTKDQSLRYLTITKGNDNGDDVKFIPLTYLRFDSESLSFEAVDIDEVGKLKSSKTKEESSQHVGPKPKSGRKSLPPDKVCQAWQLKDRGLSLVEIGEKVGRSKSALSNLFKKPRPICDSDDLLKEVLNKNKEGQ